MREAQAERERRHYRELAIAVNAGFSGKIDEAFPPPGQTHDVADKWW